MPRNDTTGFIIKKPDGVVKDLSERAGRKIQRRLRVFSSSEA
jgi:hypothetical protein